MNKVTLAIGLFMTGLVHANQVLEVTPGHVQQMMCQDNRANNELAAIAGMAAGANKARQQYSATKGNPLEFEDSAALYGAIVGAQAGNRPNFDCMVAVQTSTGLQLFQVGTTRPYAPGSPVKVLYLSNGTYTLQ